MPQLDELYYPFKYDVYSEVIDNKTHYIQLAS
jgi:hypothetical protein